MQLLIDTELKPLGIQERILKAFRQVPRHNFVPEKYQNDAYTDYPIPIGQGQTTSQPSLIAYMIQALELKENATVLEIGTGCGYATALLALLAAQVYTLEVNNVLLDNAVNNFTRLNLGNIKYHLGDGSFGWPEPLTFDAIMVNAAASRIPPPLIKQLKNNGRIVIPLGHPGMDQILTLGIKNNHNLIIKQLQVVNFVHLVSDDK